MFDYEEEQLQDYKSELKKLSIPDEQLDVAIRNGVAIANKEFQVKKRRQKSTFWSITVAAILLITFVTSVRVSPAFANAVSSIPGLGRIVEIIQYDKGIKAIVDNDYYESINVSQVKNNMTLTINGVILDEIGILISYKLEAPHSLENLKFEGVKIYNGDQLIPPGSFSYGSPDQPHNNIIDDVLEIKFLEKEVFNLKDFTLEFIFNNVKNPLETKFSIPFTLEKDIKPGKSYVIQEAVEVEGQKITIEEVTVYPTRAEVKTHFDDSNTMKLLQIEDMRIEDEKGEVWGRIQNGTTVTWFDDNHQTFYLQSSYFEPPKKFYLKFNKIQALPKDETVLVVDLIQKKVLQEPSIGLIEITEITDDYIESRFKTEERFGHAWFFQATNANGEIAETEYQSLWNDEEYQYVGIKFKENYLPSPITIEFSAYPNYIEADISIKIE